MTNTYDRAQKLKCAAVLALVLLFAAPARAENPLIVSGDTRFTVISPNLIRIEHAKNGKFLDDRSLFALNREARFTDFKLTHDGQAITIDTDAIRLQYIPDNQEISAQNLKADIHKGDTSVLWKPGAKNEANLGGTIRTLDGVSGPVNLGEGV